MFMVRTRVVLIDDHPLVRLGLKQLIAHDPRFCVCGESGSVAEVVPLVHEVDPDIVVLDLMLKDGNGFVVMKEMLSALPHLRILVLSMHDHRVYGGRCLKAGAKGYLMKDDAAELVLEALQVISAGGIFLSPSRDPGLAAPCDQIVCLSDRELQIFELIGEGLPTRVITARLNLSEKTIDAHRANIKTKLGIANGQELTRAAIAWRHNGR